jgi:transposase
VDVEATREGKPFATTTSGLLELHDWLQGDAVTHVAMEATGVYWKPVWHLLEDSFTLILANASHIKDSRPAKAGPPAGSESCVVVRKHTGDRDHEA